MKKIVLLLIVVISVSLWVDASYPNGNEIAQFIGGLALIGLTLILILSTFIFVLGIFNDAQIDREYHDRLPPAPMNDTSTIRPREGGPIPDYIPKWQRPGYDPYED